MPGSSRADRASSIEEKGTVNRIADGLISHLFELTPELGSGALGSAVLEVEDCIVGKRQIS